MSLKAYCGIPGSGKTYEVVSVVILGALARGRRVITNIAGINHQAMADHLVDQGVDADKVGQIVTVPHERVTDADFWLTESGNAQAKAQGFDNAELRILPGDLVALDEIWRFWQGFAAKDSDGKKRPDAVTNFMRMHRHFTHPESGVACDLAIITQDVMDIARQTRAVVEETYRMEKLTAIGSAKRYRVDVCPRGQTRRVLRQLQREYNPAYFPFYKSHSDRKEGDAAAKEENIDNRGNILQGALFKFVLPVGAVVFLIAFFSVKSFFTPKDPPSVSTAAVPAGATAASTHKSAGQDLSDTWRVVGWIGGSPLRVVLTDGRHQRIIEPPSWKMTGLSVEAFLPSGEAVTPWTGGAAGRGIIDQAAGK